MSATHPYSSSSEQSREPSEQEEMLKRGLVRVSIAAEGIDPLLDRRLKELRNSLRSDAPASMLTALLPDLERAVLAADQSRQQRRDQVCALLKKLIRQLQERDPPKETDRALRALSKPLDAQDNIAQSLPKLLQELTQLQAAALNSTPEQSSSGLWSRLFSKPSETPAGHSQIDELAELPASPAEEPLLAEQAATSLEQPATEAAPTVETAIETAAGDTPETSAKVSGNISGEEQNYSKVAAHVESILLNLLNGMQLLEQQETDCQRLRDQVSKGLNWYELTAVLDALAALVLNSQQNRQVEFESYLQQLNQRLSQFQGNLEDAQSSYVDSLETDRTLEVDIRDEVKVLHEDVREAEDLDTLKANVEAKLSSLLSKVDLARDRREARDSKVSERLTTMVERIQVMEVEAQTFRKHLEEQRQQAMIDTLTGLANRAGLQKRMSEEFERWQRYGGQLLLVVLDVDHFKSINDRFGHLAGDKVLRLIALQLSRRLRKTDYIGRFGGEEFVVLMPGTTLEQGAIALEELRAGIEGSPFHFKNEPVRVTISIGYTQFCKGDTLDTVFERADKAMYSAKDQGRNQVIQDSHGTHA
ncbi:GGDEF domain-containing protein [Pseudomonas neustonica]|uniref:diguanylate cyclase n=1 Tax=Pseudomonas neustonica TaxID=2487346 RepID=A0ABX9XP02_9PSED|nr:MULTISPECIES: GGDEF domain-containing protein [Pseudomonas]ROZ84580.1 GGDEF domain-containing protein [Pseudomonas sp. SSM44]ROZ86384.1 GGDEF domain-containing protein [Pseudomonas neustonica]